MITNQNHPELTLEEIKIGMTVRDYQLDNIYDTYILLANTRFVYDEERIEATEGEIVFIGEQQDNEYLSSYNKYHAPCIIINRHTDESLERDLY